MGSKFATLPDIDTTSVDVYETASSPELGPSKSSARRTAGAGDDSDVSDQEADEAGSSRLENKGRKEPQDDGRGSIDRKGLPADEAMRRFQGSTEAGRDGELEQRTHEWNCSDSTHIGFGL